MQEEEAKEPHEEEKVPEEPQEEKKESGEPQEEEKEVRSATGRVRERRRDREYTNLSKYEWFYGVQKVLDFGTGTGTTYTNKWDTVEQMDGAGFDAQLERVAKAASSEDHDDF